MGRAKGPLRVPASVWQRDAMRHALRERDVGAMFQVLKDRLGASQTQIGIAAVMSQGYVSDLIRGNARVTELAVYERIADGLAMPSHARVRLGLAPAVDGVPDDRDARTRVLAGPVAEASGPAMWMPARTVADIIRLTETDLTFDRREANERIGPLLVGTGLTEPLEHWITHDPGSAPLRSARGTVSDEEMRHIETVTHALRHWDSRFRLGIRRKAVVGQMNEVADLLNRRQPADITGRLFVALPESAKIVGSMSYDAGLYRIAQRYYRLSLRASHASGEPGRLFGANVLAAMARQMLDLDRPGDALDLVRLASMASARIPRAGSVRCCALGKDGPTPRPDAFKPFVARSDLRKGTSTMAVVRRTRPRGSTLPSWPGSLAPGTGTSPCPAPSRALPLMNSRVRRSSTSRPRCASARLADVGTGRSI